MKIIGLAQWLGTVHAEFCRDRWRVLRADADGDDRPRVAEDGVLEGLRRLSNVLIHRHQ